MSLGLLKFLWAKDHHHILLLSVRFLKPRVLSLGKFQAFKWVCKDEQVLNYLHIYYYFIIMQKTGSIVWKYYVFQKCHWWTLDSELDLSFQNKKLMIPWLLVFSVRINQTWIYFLPLLPKCSVVEYKLLCV